MKIVLYILTLIAVAILVWFAKPKDVIYETETVRDTLTVTHTEYVKQDPIIIKEKVVVRDTTIIYKDKPIQTEVARLDTVFAEGSRLSVSYFINPRIFEIEYEPAPAEVKTIEKTITETVTLKPRKWPLIAAAIGGYILGSI